MFMTQDLFTICALTVATNDALGLDGRASAEEIARAYERVYYDGNLADDLVEAAEEIAFLVTGVMPSVDSAVKIASACQTLKNAIEKFQVDGKRKRQFLRGAFFNRERTEIADKVAGAKHEVLAYHTALLTGLISARSL